MSETEKRPLKMLLFSSYISVFGILAQSSQKPPKQPNRPNPSSFSLESPARERERVWLISMQRAFFICNDGEGEAERLRERERERMLWNRGGAK